MADNTFPEMITRLPQVDIPIPGVRGWLLQGADSQAVFFSIPAGCEVPPHSHGDQWGIVVEGEMELTIDGRARRYRPGDSYFIPAGAAHGAKFLTDFRVIDVFADAARYKAKV
jgi:quercetin dioxygenase-like cupin family protein